MAEEKETVGDAKPAPRRKHLPPVNVRITKMGGGKVSTGVHIQEVGDETHEAGAIVSLPKDVALELEERGFAEIQEEPAEDKPADDAKPGKPGKK